MPNLLLDLFHISGCVTDLTDFSVKNKLYFDRKLSFVSAFFYSVIFYFAGPNAARFWVGVAISGDVQSGSRVSRVRERPPSHLL